ncbi:MAG: hypothetical protein KJP03_03780 [Gammaproteobacteria bacterium]|nr:hypothetical protein [Gammaproteobacteria bacterium]
MLNRIATSVIELQREKHPEYLFTCKEKPLARNNIHAWQKQRLENRFGTGTL